MQMFMQIEQSLKQKNQKEMYMRNMSNLLENRFEAKYFADV